MSIPQDKPLRAIVWVAVSTQEQTKEDKTSLPEQEREARAVAEREGWTIIDVLRVPGHSRRYTDIHKCNRDMLKEGIDAFDKLLQHWDERDFDILIVRDGDRFARTQSLHAYVVETTIYECGARIFVTTKGFIDERNGRMFAAMDGYMSASHVDGLVQKGRASKIYRNSQGVPTAAYIPFGFNLIRDPGTGKRKEIIVDESKRRVFDDVATLVLEGVAWEIFEKELFRRFGHVDARTGVAYKTQFFYRWLHNAWTWGNAARGYSDAKKHPLRLDIWAFDESIPLPNGVTVWRNTHEPIYKGEQAELIQAELRRRRTAIRGTARPARTHMFTGLLLCGRCGYNMGHGVANGKYHYYRCYSKYKDRSRSACTEGRTISHNKVKRWLDEKLKIMLETGQYDLLARPDSEQPAFDHIAAIKAEIEDVEAKTRRLIYNQTNAPDSLASLYDDELRAFGEQLTALRSALLQAEQRAARADMRPVRQAFQQLKAMDMDAFWEQPTTAINQMLHRLFGNRRIVVTDCEIAGLVDAP